MQTLYLIVLFSICLIISSMCAVGALLILFRKASQQHGNLEALTIFLIFVVAFFTSFLVTVQIPTMTPALLALGGSYLLAYQLFSCLLLKFYGVDASGYASGSGKFKIKRQS